LNFFNGYLYSRIVLVNKLVGVNLGALAVVLDYLAGLEAVKDDFEATVKVFSV
jgi:hypothetical protein